MKKILLILIPIALVYVAGVFYFSSHFYPNTVFGEEIVSFKDVSMISENIPVEDLHFRNGDEEISLSKLDCVKVMNTDFTGQSSLKWPVEIFRGHHYSLQESYEFNSEKLGNFLDKCDELKRQAEPQNAYIKKGEKNFEIIPEDNGTVLSYEGALEKIKKSIDRGVFVVNFEDLYKKPEITKNNAQLNEELNRLNNFSDLKIVLNSEKEHTIDRDEIYDAIIYKNGEAIIPDEYIEEVIAELNQYNTFKTARLFKTISCEEIYVGGSEKDTYGWLLDNEETFNRVKNNLFKGRVDAVWEQIPIEIGSSYIEVSLLKQHLWVVQDEEVILESDVVTGGARSGGTTPGLFEIMWHESPAVLRGADYTTHVQYWMPITHTGTGLHDASWRSSFGGEIYKTDGSHGCINLPADVAKEIYSITPDHLPVIIY